jgi:phosphatidate cytidylyltransferase
MPGESGVSGLALADPGSRWSDLTRRVISVLVLLPVVLLCIWLGGYAFLLVVATAGLVLACEWLAMCGYSSADPLLFWFPTAIVAVAISSGLGHAGSGVVVVVIGTMAAAIWGPPPSRLCHPAGQLSRQWTVPGGSGEPGHDGDQPIGPTHPRFNLAFGVPYLGLAAVALPWLRADPVSGLANTLFVLSIVWGSDIGAYMIGRLMGGPKLAPAISPGKTWSGAAGGLASAALAGLAVAACFSSDFSSSCVVGPGILLGIISQAGDLLESALKRHFGVKDSGRIIPGHGGLLDRLDALLAVAPVAALLAFTVGRGVVLWR